MRTPSLKTCAARPAHLNGPAMPIFHECQHFPGFEVPCRTDPREVGADDRRTMVRQATGRENPEAPEVAAPPQLA